MIILRTQSFKLSPLLLVICICIAQLPVLTFAEKASDYIVSYAASTTANSSNLITVSFSVTGNGTMDKIGSTIIYLYETNGNSTSLVKTFTESTHSNMTSTNKTIYTSSVTYQGTAGRSYYALVYVYAGKDGKGDTRLKTTSST